MRLMVTGSRDVGASAQVVLSDALDRHLARLGPSWEVLHGGAAGVDTFANQWCKDNGVACTAFLPDTTVGNFKAALHMRNRQMLHECDHVLAVWNGRSPGTSSVIDAARRIRKPIEVYKWNEAFGVFLLEDERQLRLF